MLQLLIILIIYLPKDMKQQTSQLQINQSNSKQNEYCFQLEANNHLKISSKFQSGNIRVVRQVAADEYILQSVKDHPHIYTKKSWFFFSMTCSIQKRIKMVVQNANIFESLIDYKKECAIVYRNQNQNEWKNLRVGLIQDVNNKNVASLSLSLQFNFESSKAVYFSLSVPFTYTDNQLYFQKLKSNIPNKISYCDQLLALTQQNREVRLITISQQSATEDRRHKPVILITSRIHPGEVTSSYCMLGIIQSLLNPNSLQSYILRRLFEWKIVPMVNPDGVVAGNYRTDLQGQNLNRHYLQPDPNFHPAIHRIVKLMKDITESNQKIQFYFDLHSHSNMKEAFIYGNAFDQIETQAYSRLFCKILEVNTLYFKNHLCQFGTKHMKFKDKGEKMSKQGCGRVTALKIAKVIRSYTLQSTIMPMLYNKIDPKTCRLSSVKNQKMKYQPPSYPTYMSFNAQIAANSQQHMLVRANKILGQAVLVSILDMLQKNPFSRLYDDFHEKQYSLLKKRLIRFQQRFKLKQMYVYYKSSLNYCKIVEQLQKQIYQSWQQCKINNQFYCNINQPLDFKLHQQDQKAKKVRRSLHYKSKQTITQQQSINKLQFHLQIQENSDKLNKPKGRLKNKLKNNSPYINLRSITFQNQQICLNDSQALDSKKYLVFPPNCFVQPTFRLNSIDSQLSEKKRIPQYLNQNFKSYELQNRKNTPFVKCFKEDSQCRKSEDRSNLSQNAKMKKIKIGNFYLAFLERRKRTKTQSKNQIELLPEIGLPRSFSSLNNKIVPVSTNQPKKDRVSESVSKVAGFQHCKKPIKASLNLPNLDMVNDVSKKNRILFTQKMPGLK